jgi:hypothetical protein
MIGGLFVFGWGHCVVRIIESVVQLIAARWGENLVSLCQLGSNDYLDRIPFDNFADLPEFCSQFFRPG